MIGERVVYEGVEMTWEQAALQILRRMAAFAKATGNPIPNAGVELHEELDALPRVP